MLERRNIEVEWQGKKYEVIPNPDLLTRIEARPDGFAVSELMESMRLTDHAHIIYCALVQAGAFPMKTEVTAAVMDDINKWTAKSLEIIVELIAPPSKLDKTISETVQAGKDAPAGN